MKLLREIQTNENGEFLDRHGDVLPEPLPNGILESIMEIRETAIAALLDLPYTQIKRYEDSAYLPPYLCQARFGSVPYGSHAACDNLVYGSLTYGLYARRLWPRKTPESIHESINALAVHINTLTICTLSEHHSNCHVYGFKAKAKRILEELPSPVLDSHRKHMREQRGED